MTADSQSHAPYRHYPKIEVLAARGRRAWNWERSREAGHWSRCEGARLMPPDSRPRNGKNISEERPRSATCTGRGQRLASGSIGGAAIARCPDSSRARSETSKARRAKRVLIAKCDTINQCAKSCLLRRHWSGASGRLWADIVAKVTKQAL
jgi:hypothetical protein